MQHANHSSASLGTHGFRDVVRECGCTNGELLARARDRWCAYLSLWVSFAVTVSQVAGAVGPRFRESWASKGTRVVNAMPMAAVRRALGLQ